MYFSIQRSYVCETTPWTMICNRITYAVASIMPYYTSAIVWWRRHCNLGHALFGLQLDLPDCTAQKSCFLLLVFPVGPSFPTPPSPARESWEPKYIHVEIDTVPVFWILKQKQSLKVRQIPKPSLASESPGNSYRRKFNVCACEWDSALHRMAEAVP